VTLAELGDRIRQGDMIRVIDNDTKADLTEMTMTQILMAQQKKKQKGIINIVQEQAGILLQRISIPVQQIRDEALRQVENQVERFRHRSDNAVPETPLDNDGATNGSETRETSSQERPSEEKDAPTPSILTRLETLKQASDEKLLSYLLFQRVEQLEEEVADLKKRLELLERKDDENY
jgi:polyhydroxyalkanoate synthesis regulator protein